MLSVVIPTRDRRELLLETLGILERQDPTDGPLEVVVVDNASRDDTADAVREFAAVSDLRLRLASEPRPGPAAARNRGVEAAAGETILLLGDDMAPADTGLLAEHERLHRRHPEAEYALLGRATWHPGRQVTGLMEWLEAGGIQFAFDGLPPGPVDPARHFCTAHVSVKRDLLRRVGGFDERFSLAALEDVEIGSRLRDAGVVLEYRPELLVHHTHPIGLAGSLERSRSVGQAAALFHEIHPDEVEVVGRPEGLRWWLVGHTCALWRLLAEGPFPRRIRELGYRALHQAAYAEGYRLGPPARGSSGTPG